MARPRPFSLRRIAGSADKSRDMNGSASRYPGRRAGRAGFTIIEMLIVVTILAMLAGILVPVLESEAATARDARR
ncbi:MAG: prepilin-type N-terminal cleavage/methylation domain-containing protein, partial [Planctomycetota bacterium]